MEFATAAQEWKDLLRVAAHDAFAKTHFDAIAKLAVALSCAADVRSGATGCFLRAF